MQTVIARHAARVGPAPALVVNIAPALRRAAAPRQRRRLNVTLQINRQRKLFAAQTANQAGGSAKNFQRIAPPVKVTIHLDDFVHGAEAAEESGIFTRGEEDNFRVGKMLANLPDRRQRENHVADGLEADEQNVLTPG